ncbi:hypothetical protein [Lysobacter gummosus]|uniref:Uncharacterized protein n=1 Tax=Lysobacter gummosus TaxID=262324 RepID=A0ABY3XF05_9GAMM|nr:hypothetical protein [Lysobacter gummosus]UNP30220.1 hypothetical protein MOV92_02770 [Lysobacter gummosus]
MSTKPWAIQSAPQSDAPSLTIEDILRLPLEQGADGYDRISKGLRSIGQFSVFRQEGVLTLSDGHRINIVVDYTSAGILSIGVDKARCFTLKDAVRITGAKPVSAVSYPYVEGPNYDTYSAIANGVDVNIGKFTAGENCLTEIHLVDVQTAAEFVMKNKLELPAKNLPVLKP